MRVCEPIARPDVCSMMVRIVVRLSLLWTLIGCADPDPPPPPRPSSPQDEACPGRHVAGEAGSLPAQRPPPPARTFDGFDESYCRVAQGALECWGSVYGGGRVRRVEGIDDAREVHLFRQGGCVWGGARVSCWSMADEMSIGPGRTLEIVPGTPAVVHGDRLELPLRHRALENAIDWSQGDGIGCALREDRTVACFSLPTLRAREIPPLANVVRMEPIAGCSCALHEDGRVTCFGRSCAPITGVSEPVTVIEDLRDASAISVGPYELCAIRGTRVECRGDSHIDRRTGDHGDAIRRTRWDVQGLDGLSAPVDLDSSCVLHADGERSCWGWYHGCGPARRFDAPGPVRHHALGSESECVELRDGRVFCRGSGAQGQLAQGRERRVDEPILARTSGRAVDLALGETFACALNDAGEVECWGVLPWARREGWPHAARLPVAVRELTGAAAIWAGYDTLCASDASGVVRCVGVLPAVLRRAQRGEPAPWYRDVLGADGGPLVLDALRGATQIAVGPHHACGIVSGEVQCVPAERVRVTAIAIAIGSFGTCAADASRRVHCWEPASEPVPVPELAGATHLEAMAATICARIDGARRCLDYDGAPVDAPIEDAPARFELVRYGVQQTACGIDGGSVWCWGDVPDGQAGDGIPMQTRRWVRVR